MRIFTRASLVSIAVLAVTSSIRAADGPDLLPASTRAVVTLDIKQLLACPAIRNELPTIRETMHDNLECQFLLSTIGFDPLKDLERVWLAMSDMNDEDDISLVARGSFDRAKIKALADKAAKARKDTFKLQQVGAYHVYEAWLPEQEKPVFICFADNKTMVISTKKKHVTGALDIHAGKKKSALPTELAGLLKKTNPRQCLAIAALGPAFAGKGGHADKILHAQGGVAMTDHFQADFLVTTKDVGSAITIADEFHKGVKAIAEILTSLADDPEERSTFNEIVELVKVNPQGNTISISVRISAEVFQKWLARDAD